jgi:hypothetical protein
MADLPKYDNLVIKGGGVKAYAYPSAIYWLNNYGLLRNVTRIAGSSAGAIIAGLLCCGASPDDLIEFMQVDFLEFKDDSNGVIRDIYRLLNRFGYCKGEKFVKWYRECLGKLTGKKDINFETASNLYGKDLYITGTNLTEGELDVFNPYVTPQMRIWEAVRISISIPFFFVPWKYNGCYYVDGGLLCNFYNFPSGNTLGLYLVSSDDYRRIGKRNFKNLKEFSSSIIDVVMFQLENQYVDKELWDNTVKISTDHLSAIDFDLTEAQKDYLGKQGKLAVEKFINKKLRA